MRKFGTLPVNEMFAFFRCLTEMSLILSSFCKIYLFEFFLPKKEFGTLPVYEMFT